MEEPHCMNCQHAWSRAFLDAHLTHSWVEGALRKHRENILFDRERSLLPMTQDAAATERNKRRLKNNLAEVRALYNAARDKYDNTDRDVYIATQSAVAPEILTALRKQRLEEGRTMRLLKKQMLEVRDLLAAGGDGVAAAEPHRTFVAACPKESCRGFLSTAYKCGTCETQFCAQCREPKAEGHECSADLVATIREIVRDSRPCPHCGTAISRVSGCDQMYCTQCDTAFSYGTGQVIRGVIHNPHYFEKMRAGQVPAHRQEGDAPCGGWPAFRTVLRYITNGQSDLLQRIYQSAMHAEHAVLPEYPRETDRADNTDLRVRYLLGDFDDATLRQRLQQRERKRQMELEVRGPLEVFVLATLELFQQIVADTYLTSERLNEYYAKMEATVNAPLRSIGDRYKKTVPQLDLSAVATHYSFLRIYGYKPVKPKGGSSSNAASTD